jgi:hypothetical protein
MSKRTFNDLGEIRARAELIRVAANILEEIGIDFGDQDINGAIRELEETEEDF